MGSKYYSSRYLEDLINRLGIEAYYKLLEKIDETQLIIEIIIERLEEYKKQLEAVATATKKKTKP